MRWNLAELLAAAGFGGLALLAILADREDRELEPDDEPKADPPPDDERAIPATPELLDQLDAELAGVGVVNFSARELTANRVKGKRVHFIPPAKFRPNLLRAAQLAQNVRTAWGDRLCVSSGYRPQDGPKSRHYTAKAIDLDLPSGQRTTANRDRLYLLAASLYLGTSKGGRTGFGGMGFYTQPKGRLHVDVRDRPTYWKASIVEPYFKQARKA